MVTGQQKDLSSTEESLPAGLGWAVFIIRGPELNPDYISDVLGIQADKVSAPDPDQGEEGIWQLNSSLTGSVPLIEHFWNLLERLTPAYKKLRELKKHYRLEMYCSLHGSEESPGILKLSSRALMLCSYIGADLEIESET